MGGWRHGRDGRPDAMAGWGAAMKGGSSSSVNSKGDCPERK